MKLYYIETSNPRKACAVAKHLGLPVEYVHLDAARGGLKTPEYLAINPNGLAPTLVDGDLKLWESMAILAYLAIRAESDLWPTRDALEQIEILRWLSWDAKHWARAVGPFYFEHHIKAMFGLGEPDREGLADKLPPLHRFAKVLDDHLAGRSFVACDRLTIADFCLAAMLPGWERLELPLEGYANIRRWHDGLLKLDAWREPWPAKA